MISTFNINGVLSDLDGTLVDSTPSVVATWSQFAQDYPFIDLDHVLQHSHGVRTYDNMIKYCKLENPEIIKSEAQRFESLITEMASKRQQQGLSGMVVLPGVKNLIDQFNVTPSRWSIVTSATKIYAASALEVSGINQIQNKICADNVVRGKPNPDPFLEGAKLINVKANECLVLEDAPNGIKAGKAAGAVVIATLTSHDFESIKNANPDFIVRDLSSISAQWEGDHYKIMVNSINN